MRIRIKRYCLNDNFDIPVTLRYEYGRYQPVLLTFMNDKRFGAGIVFTSPEHGKGTVVYFNQCIQFEGFGRMTYTTDLMFKLYYNDYCIYFLTESGEVAFEHQLPPIQYGRFTCIA